MYKMVRTCYTCSGCGRVDVYKVVSEGMAQREETVCGNCGGKGYKEFAVFTLEEAAAIMKHCGLIGGEIKMAVLKNKDGTELLEVG